MLVEVKNEMAKIAINKSLLKEFETSNGRTVYLKNGDEYQIQLYNPTSDDIAALIYIDGKELSNKLIIKPAQRIWLERYLDVPRKFKFNTYEIEDTLENKNITKNNGVITISFFYKNRQHTLTATNNLYNLETYLNSCDKSDYIINKDFSTYCTANNIEQFSKQNICGCIETGRTEIGSSSNQMFENVNMEFEYFPFKTETINILPMSRKQYTANDLEKIYCCECGRKLKIKYKFCPFCGTKIN